MVVMSMKPLSGLSGWKNSRVATPWVGSAARQTTSGFHRTDPPFLLGFIHIRHFITICNSMGRQQNHESTEKAGDVTKAQVTIVIPTFWRQKWNCFHCIQIKDECWYCTINTRWRFKQWGKRQFLVHFYYKNLPYLRNRLTYLRK